MNEGDKVRAIETKVDLGVGTIDEIVGEYVYVYWPKLKHVGCWPIDKLEKVEGK